MQYFDMDKNRIIAIQVLVGARAWRFESSFRHPAISGLIHAADCGFFFALRFAPPVFLLCRNENFGFAPLNFPDALGSVLRSEMRVNQMCSCTFDLCPSESGNQANLETKRKAIEQVDGITRLAKPPRWKRDQDLLTWLDSL